MGNNGWFDFMNSRTARMVCDAIVIIACARYAIEAGHMLLHPESYAMLVENVGTTGFYLLEGAQILVCVFAVVQFARRLFKDYQEK